MCARHLRTEGLQYAMEDKIQLWTCQLRLQLGIVIQVDKDEKRKHMKHIEHMDLSNCSFLLGFVGTICGEK
jgi:uncharacterized membrane protein YsdA (DUF1294 family)